MDNEMPSFQFYNPEKDRAFTVDRCFLCGKIVAGDNSKEHIFPKWLQEEFGLWNKQLTLLNDTGIPYRSLTIPCCADCNNVHLSEIENHVSSTYRQGYKVFTGIDPYILFLWLSKIFYGLLFKELLLPYNRANPTGGSILTEEDFERFSMAHLFLQGARIPIRFQHFVPWSIFIFNSQVSEIQEMNFDFRDSLIDMTFGIRMGEISVIAVLQDNGAQQEIFGEYIAELQGLRIYPIQFGELCAMTTYKQRLFNRTPKYIIAESGDHVEVIAMPLQGLSAKPIYDDWSQEAYSHHLAFHVQVPRERIYSPPDRVMTWLRNEDGTLKRMCEDSEFL
jgi:hypothetical protein